MPLLHNIFRFSFHKIEIILIMIFMISLVISLDY